MKTLRPFIVLFFYSSALFNMQLPDDLWLNIIARSASSTKKALKQTCHTLSRLATKNCLQLYLQSPLSLTTRQGDYALTFCAYHNNLPAIKNLLAQHYDTHYHYSGIVTGELNIAYHNNNQEMIKILEDHCSFKEEDDELFPYPLAAFVGDCTTLEQYMQSSNYQPFYKHNHQPYTNKSLLYPAIMRGHNNIITLLLQNQKTIEHINENNNGSFLVRCALEAGNAFIAEQLLAIPSIDLCQHDNHIAHSLFDCAEKGYLDCVKLLVKQKPTCINMVVRLSSVSNIYAEEGIACLYKFCANIPALTIACLCGRYNVVRFLLRQKNIDCNARAYGYATREGCFTPLYAAALKGHKRIAKLLLKCPTIDPFVCMGHYTPLHIACKKGHLTIVKALVQHSPKLLTMETQDEHKLLPLDLAKMSKKKRIIRFLKTMH